MDMPFFTQFLMISDPMTIGILVLFVIALGYVYFLQKRKVHFGTLVMIATVVGAVLGVAVQLIDSLKIQWTWCSLRKARSGSL